MLSLLSHPFCSSCSAQAIPPKQSLTEPEFIVPPPPSSIFYIKPANVNYSYTIPEAPIAPDENVQSIPEGSTVPNENIQSRPPEAPIVPDENKALEQRLKNLPRYAEICDLLKFEVLKGLCQKLCKLDNNVLSFIQTHLFEPLPVLLCKLEDNVLNTIQTYLSNHLPVLWSENAAHIVDNPKQIQNTAYLIFFSEQLSNDDGIQVSNDGTNVPPTLITQILNYVEQHQDQPDHVGVIMENLSWYALACLYSKGQLPENVQVPPSENTREFLEFQSSQNLLAFEEYTKLAICFMITKPKTDQTETTRIVYMYHSKYRAYLLQQV